MLLIIDNDTKSGTSLAASFSYMGILAHSAKPSSALNELCDLYRAVLIRAPERLPDTRDFIKRLKAYGSTLPIFALCDNDEDLNEKTLFSAVFTPSRTPAEIAIGIIKASELLGCYPIGQYLLAGINASCNLVKTEYFFKRFKLTAKESMILRFLIRAYPTPKSTADILKYVFPPSKRPEPSAVRTHISSLNKIFQGISGKRLIYNIKGDGYVIMTPELAEANEERELTGAF